MSLNYTLFLCLHEEIQLLTIYIVKINVFLPSGQKQQRV